MTTTNADQGDTMSDQLQDTEVRITHLRPGAIRKRLSDKPVAWLPVGTLEWHGFHLPLGLDGLKAEALCRGAAERLGGLVFPTMFYGDHRGVLQEALFVPRVFSELTFDHRERLAQELGGEAGYHAANGTREQDNAALDRHADLLLRTFWMIRAYGFTRIVAIAGHYPNNSPLQAAIRRFHAVQTSCRVIGGTEEQLSGVPGGDHAARYETAQMMALLPELVDLEDLDHESGEPLGVRGIDPREATAEFGVSVLDGLVERMAVELTAVPAMPPFGDVDEDGTPPAWPTAPLVGSKVLDELFVDPANL